MKENHKPGRPTKYCHKFTPESFRCACALGATNEDLATIFNISQQTIATWKQKHPEFLDAIKKGKEIADEAVEKALFQRACGYSHPDTHFVVIDGQVIQTPRVKYHPPETVACIFWLKNRQPTKWRDKVQAEISGADGGPIPLELMTREQIKAELRKRGALPEGEA